MNQNKNSCKTCGAIDARNIYYSRMSKDGTPLFCTLCDKCASNPEYIQKLTYVGNLDDEDIEERAYAQEYAIKHGFDM